MSLEKRVSALEAAAGAGDPCRVEKWHQVVVHEGESLADAVRAYGIEKIGKHDDLIVRRILPPPQFDEQGHMISRPPEENSGPREENWRELCGL